MLSIDCFLGTSTETSLEANNDFFRIYYIKLLIMGLLPILLFLCCYIVWGIYSCKTKDYSNLKSRAISSLIILLFLFHPNIVQYMFSAFKYIFSFNTLVVIKLMMKKEFTQTYKYYATKDLICFGLLE